MHDAEHENAIGRQQLVEHQEGRYDELANVGAIYITLCAPDGKGDSRLSSP